MVARKLVSTAVASSMLLGMAGGCGEEKQTQGAVIGGVGGAAAGALIGGSENRLLGALIGGALGAGGGYLIGTQLEKADEDDRDDAIQASQNAERNPATVEQARQSSSADVNGDGYITLDEVIAMEGAGLSDDEIIRRLDATDMFFELTPQQKEQLRKGGVSQRVIDAMGTINQDVKKKASERLNTRTGQNIGERS